MGHLSIVLQVASGLTIVRVRWRDVDRVSNDDLVANDRRSGSVAQGGTRQRPIVPGDGGLLSTQLIPSLFWQNRYFKHKSHPSQTFQISISPSEQ